MINLIAAVGRRGQVGRNGKLPWGDRADLQAAMRADQAQFQKITLGSIVVMGLKTFNSIDDLPGRLIIGWDQEDTVDDDLIDQIKRRAGTRPIWIAGGAKTYRAFAPYVDGVRIFSHIRYDNAPCEDREHVFFPFDAYGIRWQ